MKTQAINYGVDFFLTGGICRRIFAGTAISARRRTSRSGQGVKFHQFDPTTGRFVVKLTPKLLLLSSLATTVAFAQNQYIKNVIIVIQENRTPDNLFQALCTGSNCGTGSNQFNLQSYGQCLYNNSEQNVPLLPLGIENNCADPGHFHSDWTSMYDGVNGHYMDGACNDPSTTCRPFKHACPFGSGLDCTRYSYVDNTSGVIDPYLSIAQQYG
jgi:hypothetical protein